MSTKQKNGTVVELKAEEVQAQEPETAEGAQERTIFGKIDDKIMSKRAENAAKKEAKAKAKEEKASEGKKISWKKVAAIGAGVVGTVGTVLAVIEHNQIVNLTDGEACCDAPALEAPTVEVEVQSEPAVQENVS